MKLRRYCVTIMDNWTPIRTFWTFKGAMKFYHKHRYGAYTSLYKWIGDKWVALLGGDR